MWPGVPDHYFDPPKGSCSSWRPLRCWLRKAVVSVTNEGETGTLGPESRSLGGLGGSGMHLVSSAYKKSATLPVMAGQKGLLPDQRQNLKFTRAQARQCVWKLQESRHSSPPPAPGVQFAGQQAAAPLCAPQAVPRVIRATSWGHGG